MSVADKRWKAVVTYRLAGNAVRPVILYFDELEELHDLIERGPTFEAIEKIVITYQLERTTLMEAAIA